MREQVNQNSDPIISIASGYRGRMRRGETARLVRRIRGRWFNPVEGLPPVSLPCGSILWWKLRFI